MVKIKGTVLNDAVKAVKAQLGDQVYDAIVDLLEGETRALFERAFILSSNWYSLDAFVQFLEMDLKVTAQGNEQVLIKWSEASTERQLRGVYHMFAESESPELVIQRIAGVHQTYFQGVGIEASLLSAGKAILKYTGFAKRHRLIGLTIIGFFRKALEMAGAKAVKAEYTTLIEDDKGYCELVLSWSE